MNPPAPRERLQFIDGAVVVPHLGITLRAIMGCALANNESRPAGREVNIVYKELVIGHIRLKTEI